MDTKQQTISPELDAHIRSTYGIAVEMARPIREALEQLPHKVAAAPLRELDGILDAISDRLLGCDETCEYCETPIFGVDMDAGAGMAGDCWLCVKCMEEARQEYIKGVANGTVDPETGEAFADQIESMAGR
jgi:hypothetical protein